MTQKIKIILSSVLSLAVLSVLLFMLNQTQIAQICLVLSLTGLAVGSMGHPLLKRFGFTFWVFVFVATSLFYPKSFGTWFGLDLKILIVPLIQIIMFGMGTTLNMGDFKRVVLMPWPVFIGMLLQFTVMPLTGYALTQLFDFEPEVAAGVILVGTCPGGVASNLMAFLAGGNVALSVTMTSCSTMLSPLMTPFMMKILAGKFVPIQFLAMMLSILNMIIVPIIAGVFANKILFSKKRWSRRPVVLGGIGGTGVLIAIGIMFFHAEKWGALSTLRNGAILGFLLMGVVALSKLVIRVWLKGPENWIDKTLPVVSMAGIVLIIAIITARSSEKLVSVGLLLIAAAIIHNFVGYISGYWISKLARLDERSCRTVAFEVGMQNGGMATGLAMAVLNSAKAALAPAIFGPWMNVSGSVLATWWHRSAEQFRNDNN